MLQYGRNIWTDSWGAGDIIYHLAPFKEHGGGAFYLLKRPNHPAATHWFGSNEQLRRLLELIQRQSFVRDTTIVDHVVGTDIGQWVRTHLVSCVNLSDQMSKFLGLPPVSKTDPWLRASPTPVAKVVINRSARHHTGTFDWKAVTAKYRRDAVFVGSPLEHSAFCSAFGRIKYLPTADYWQLAQVIAGCKLFVGNQSSPLAVAEGLKRPKVQESIPLGDLRGNCHWERPLAWYGTAFLPELEALPDPVG